MVGRAALGQQVDVGGAGDLAGGEHDHVLHQGHATCSWVAGRGRADDVHVVVGADPAADAHLWPMTSMVMARPFFWTMVESFSAALGRLEVAPEQGVAGLQRDEHLLADDVLVLSGLTTELVTNCSGMGRWATISTVSWLPSLNVRGGHDDVHQVPAPADLNLSSLDGPVRHEPGEHAEHKGDQQGRLALQHGGLRPAGSVKPGAAEMGLTNMLRRDASGCQREESLKNQGTYGVLPPISRTSASPSGTGSGRVTPPDHGAAFALQDPRDLRLARKRDPAHPPRRCPPPRWQGR